MYTIVMDGSDLGGNDLGEKRTSMSVVALGVAALIVAALIVWGLSSVFGADSDSDAGKKVKKGKNMMKAPGKAEYKDLGGNDLGEKPTPGKAEYKDLGGNDLGEKPTSTSVVALGVAALTGAALLGWGLSSVFGADSDTDARKKGKEKMKAPGKDEYILREEFEKDPQRYFRDLRGKK